MKLEKEATEEELTHLVGYEIRKRSNRGRINTPGWGVK